MSCKSAAPPAVEWRERERERNTLLATTPLECSIGWPGRLQPSQPGVVVVLCVTSKTPGRRAGAESNGALGAGLIVSTCPGLHLFHGTPCVRDFLLGDCRSSGEAAF
jgi:hypothetical protein